MAFVALTIPFCRSAAERSLNQAGTLRRRPRTALCAHASASLPAPHLETRHMDASDGLAIDAESYIEHPVSVEPHVLYIVSTPIGNPADISQRALRVLASVDVIAAEDTRRARLLLNRVLPRDAARVPNLLSFHAHNWRSRAPGLIARLLEGESVALVSDAGTPCVSDPGAELAAAAIAEGVRVVPVPGACAALATLVCAALPPGVEFVVVGFVPRSGSARKSVLARIGSVYKDAAVVVYEAPHRISETLADIAGWEAPQDSGVSNVRSVCIGREVTKKYEEFLRFDSAVEAALYYPKDGIATDTSGSNTREPRGEFTIVLGPARRSAPTLETSDEEKTELELDCASCDMRELIKSLVLSGIPTSVISKCVSNASNLSRKLVYAHAMQLKQSSPTEAKRQPS
jgi:16S rRNA (cytidine1402-2'-O)-methyltransferase